MYFPPRFVHTLRAQILQTISALTFIWFHRNLKKAEENLLKQRTGFAYWQRRFGQLLGLGYSPTTIHTLFKEYGVSAGSAGAIIAIALRHHSVSQKKHAKQLSRQKMLLQLTRPVTSEKDTLNKARRLRSVLCHPFLNLDPSLRRLVDGITLSRNERSIGTFYGCIVHLLQLSDDEFPPKPDMTGIERDPTLFDWANESEE